MARTRRAEAVQAAKFYMPSNYDSLRVSTADGGCGLEHVVADDQSVTCVQCEPFAIKWLGAAVDVEHVALSPAEEWEQERLNNEGRKQVEGIVEALGRFVGEANKK